MHSKLMSTASVAVIALAVGVSTTSVSTDAHADGHSVNWGGGYLGLHLGGGQANWEGIYKGPVGTTSAVFADALQTDGVFAGLHGGFNWQMGTTVVGIEADASFMDWTDQVSAIGSSETISG